MRSRARKAGKPKPHERRDRNTVAIRFGDSEYAQLLARVNASKPKYVKLGPYLRHLLLEKFGISDNANEPSAPIRAATA